MPLYSQIKLAGREVFLEKINPRDQDCTSFRSKARIPMTDEVVEHPGGLVKFAVPYSDNHGRYLGVVTEEDLEYDQKNRVYHCKHFSLLNLSFIQGLGESVLSFSFNLSLLLLFHNTKGLLKYIWR